MTRSLRNILGSLAPLIALAFLLVPSGALAAQPGLVQVKGIAISDTVDVNLEDALGSPTLAVPGQAGTKGWPVREVLIYAQDQTGAFDIETLGKNVKVSRTGKGDLSVDRLKVRNSAYDNQLPIFFIDSDGNTAMWEKGGAVPTVYTDSAPVVDVPKSLEQKLAVRISPTGTIKLKSGESEAFTATLVSGDPAKVALTWSVDGVSKSSSTPNKFVFSNKKQGTYRIQVLAQAPGAAAVVDSVTVVVGKPEKKKEKKDEDDPPADNPPDDSGYVPGYYPDYGSGSGTGTGTGTPSTGSPSQANPRKQKQDKEEPPADDGLETVSGQLVDPTQIATVVPSDTPSSSGEEAQPAEDEKKGGGISDGALTAIGIGALLGLGGLTEAGAFAGFRRFRFRP